MKSFYNKLILLKLHICPVIYSCLLFATTNAFADTSVARFYFQDRDNLPSDANLASCKLDSSSINSDNNVNMYYVDLIDTEGKWHNIKMLEFSAHDDDDAVGKLICTNFYGGNKIRLMGASIYRDYIFNSLTSIKASYYMDNKSYMINSNDGWNQQTGITYSTGLYGYGIVNNLGSKTWSNEGNLVPNKAILTLDNTYIITPTNFELEAYGLGVDTIAYVRVQWKSSPI